MAVSETENDSKDRCLWVLLNTIGWTNSVPVSGLLESNRMREAMKSTGITLDHSSGVIEENLDSLSTHSTDQQCFNQRKNSGTDLAFCTVLAFYV